MARLDDAYSNAAYIPGGEDYPARWEAAARDFRGREAAVGRARLNLPYGDGPRHAFDLFYPAGRPEGLLVFVHGGYWMTFGRESWSHLARGAQAQGWAVAIPSYTLAPEARIAAITREIAAALGAAAEEVPHVPLALAGHSAGGHLAARMLCRDVPLPRAVSERIVGVMPISPLSDLRPLLETSMNDTLGLDPAEALAESPVAEPNPRTARVHVWVGADERPAFRDQARWLVNAWGAEFTEEGGRHHFDVIEGLEHADSPMIRALLGV